MHFREARDPVIIPVGNNAWRRCQGSVVSAPKALITIPSRRRARCIRQKTEAAPSTCVNGRRSGSDRGSSAVRGLSGGPSGIRFGLRVISMRVCERYSASAALRRISRIWMVPRQLRRGSYVVRGAVQPLSSLAQRVSDRHNQIAAKIIGRFAVRIFDAMVTSVISKLPVFKFSVAILDDLGANLSANKVI